MEVCEKCNEKINPTDDANYYEIGMCHRCEAVENVPILKEALRLACEYIGEDADRSKYLQAMFTARAKKSGISAVNSTKE